MSYCSVQDVRDNINADNTDDPTDAQITKCITRADAELDSACSGDAHNFNESVQYSFDKSEYKLRHDFKEITKVQVQNKVLDEFDENNVIDNGIIEESANGDDPDYWTDSAGSGDTLSWATDYSYTLNRSLKIAKGANVSSTWTSDGQSVDMESDFKATARVKVDSTTSGNVYLKMLFYDESDILVQTFTSAAVTIEITQPTAASAIAIVSSDNDDTTQAVTVVGTVNGLDDVEAVTLTGTTSVSTAKSFSYIKGIRKSADTEGTITCTSNAAAVTNATLTATQSGKNDWIRAEVHGSSSPASGTVKAQFYAETATSGNCWCDDVRITRRNWRPLYASRELKILSDKLSEGDMITVYYKRSQLHPLVKEISKDIASVHIIAGYYGAETAEKSYSDIRYAFYGGRFIGSPKVQFFIYRIDVNIKELLSQDGSSLPFIASKMKALP